MELDNTLLAEGWRKGDEVLSYQIESGFRGELKVLGQARPTRLPTSKDSDGYRLQLRSEYSTSELHSEEPPNESATPTILTLPVQSPVSEKKQRDPQRATVSRLTREIARKEEMDLKGPGRPGL
ncbi:hypothetical protein K0M31_018699 [Melipona bicolor]|uniref:Uncharacterized protein n=1 Tax=Melipona bicolor TaxID=60889 RepID=A0AA40G441_9HYME|nr:hypothetical protein K0M31_018699 [Melipona bicolor]